jgi:WD40 repeat protein
MDGRRIVSGAEDGKIIIWDADTKEIIRCLSHHTDWVNCIQFSPDEKRLASASSDGTLKIWDADTGELVFDFDDHQGSVWTVAYSPNGAKIASGSKDRTVRIWNATTGKQQTQPLIHDNEVSSIVWSPDSRRLISGCADGQIYFWSAPTGAQLGSPLHAHSRAIFSLAISPDGELVASASKDRTARLWSTSTRKPFGRVLQHADEVNTVAFSPDGQLVATGSDENMAIFLWDISHESTIMTNIVSPKFISPASHITSYIDQVINKLYLVYTAAYLMQVLFKPTASSDSLTELSDLSAPALDELPNVTEFPSETADSRDAATSPSPSLPPQGHINHDIPSPVRISPPVELTDGFPVPPEAINSRDAAGSPSPGPSFPSHGSSRPHIAAASASTPALSSPLRSFWKCFPILNRPAASVDSKRWKFPHIGTIMYAILRSLSKYVHVLNLIFRRRKHRNVESQAGPNDDDDDDDAQH